MPYNPNITPRESDPGYDARNKADALAELKKRTEAKAAEQAAVRAQKEALLMDKFSGRVMSIKEAEALEEAKMGTETASLRERMRAFDTAAEWSGASEDEVAAARKKALDQANLKKRLSHGGSDRKAA